MLSLTQEMYNSLMKCVAGVAATYLDSLSLKFLNSLNGYLTQDSCQRRFLFRTCLAKIQYSLSGSALKKSENSAIIQLFTQVQSATASPDVLDKLVRLRDQVRAGLSERLDDVRTKHVQKRLDVFLGLALLEINLHGQPDILAEVALARVPDVEVAQSPRPRGGGAKCNKQ